MRKAMSSKHACKKIVRTVQFRISRQWLIFRFGILFMPPVAAELNGARIHGICTAHHSARPSYGGEGACIIERRRGHWYSVFVGESKPDVIRCGNK